MLVTPYQVALRFLGLEEVAGATANPQVLAMLILDNQWPKDDSVPWCSAFVNYICWLLGLPRSRSLRARSWLGVGYPVSLIEAQQGFDVVVLKRGSGDQPGPEVLDAPGHVGFFSGASSKTLELLGGNQADSVSIASYPITRILGIRRLS